MSGGLPWRSWAVSPLVSLCPAQMLSVEEFKAVFHASPDGIVVVRADGSIHTANPKAEKLFGYGRGELEDTSVEDLLPEGLRNAHRGHREAFSSRPKDRAMGLGLELRARRRDGSDFPVEISLSPWEGADGELRIICIVRDLTERIRMRSFTESALRASEEERSRISRELHDDTAQRLATLLLRLRALSEARDDSRRGELSHLLREEIVETADSVRRMARGLRPPELEQLGLTAALQAHARKLEEHENFRLDLRIDPVDPLLDDRQQLVLYRIIQEATHNARQHSGAARATLDISVEEEVIAITVSDEGTGFEPDEISARSGGLGLIGMRERAAMIGGGLSLDSEPGKGTSIVVRLRIPLQENDNG